MYRIACRKAGDADLKMVLLTSIAALVTALATLAMVLEMRAQRIHESSPSIVVKTGGGIVKPHPADCGVAFRLFNVGHAPSSSTIVRWYFDSESWSRLFKMVLGRYPEARISPIASFVGWSGRLININDNLISKDVGVLSPVSFDADSGTHYEVPRSIAAMLGLWAQLIDEARGDSVNAHKLLEMPLVAYIKTESTGRTRSKSTTDIRCWRDDFTPSSFIYSGNNKTDVDGSDTTASMGLSLIISPTQQIGPDAFSLQSVARMVLPT